MAMRRPRTRWGQIARQAGTLASAAGSAFSAGREVSKAYSAAKKAYKHVTKKPTKRRKRRNLRVQSAVPGPNTMTKTTYKPSKKSGYNIVKKIGNSARYEVTNTWSMTTSESLQGTTLVDSMGGNVEMVDVFSKAAKAYNTTTATVIGATANTAFFSCQKLLWKSCIQELNFCNQSQVVCNVILYHCVSKVTQPYQNPLTLWNAGDIDQENVGSLTNNQVGAVPTSSKSFNMVWKVIKKQRYKMTPGEYIRDTWIFKPQRYIDMEYWNQYGAVRGLTTSTFAICYGQVADTVLGPTVGFIGTTACKIVGTSKKVYQSELVNFWPRTAFRQTTALHTGDTATLYTVNDTSGLAQNISTTGGASTY